MTDRDARRPGEPREDRLGGPATGSPAAGSPADAPAEPGDVTRLLDELRSEDGSRDERVLDRLYPLVYEELRALAQARLRAERADHTLSATALVHEAYLKLVDQTRVEWRNRAQFFAIAATAMRRLLIDHAKAKRAAKRGGDRPIITLDDDIVPGSRGPAELLELDEALNRLEAMDARQAQVVVYRFFVGLKDREIAEVLDVSVPTVRRDWRLARAWLGAEMRDRRGGD